MRPGGFMDGIRIAANGAIRLNGTDEYAGVAVPSPGNFEEGADILLDGGFESATGTADDGTSDTFPNWTQLNAGTARYDIGTDVPPGSLGTKSLRIYTTGTGVNTAVLQSDNITVTPGANYAFNFWTKGSGSFAARYKIYDVTHSADIVATTDTGWTANSWRKKSVVFTVPTGCTTIYIWLVQPINTDQIGYYDDCYLRQVYDFSVLMWIKRSGSNNVVRQYTTNRMEGTYNRRWYHRFMGTGEGDDAHAGAFVWGMSYTGANDGWPVQSTTIAQQGVWYLAIGTYQVVPGSGVNLNLYINGVQEGGTIATYATLPATTPPLRIGATAVVGSEHYFLGDIGEVQIVRGVALTGTQALSCFQNGIPATWVGGTILAHYKWGGVTDGAFLADQTTVNNLTGTNVDRAGNQIVW